ncbi:uncharacterized protein LOC130563188 [Triplophysa rosa]|uniref:uncharacterized protein LOC130563188 n=1 Tax=Triplophysa rosa TaxID=992332 RepID=UPI0025461E61|nr:uncharacterized protein LOC130563188 [Triplophysa rosa]
MRIHLIRQERIIQTGIHKTDKVDYLGQSSLNPTGEKRSNRNPPDQQGREIRARAHLIRQERHAPTGIHQTNRAEKSGKSIERNPSSRPTDQGEQEIHAASPTLQADKKTPRGKHSSGAWTKKSLINKHREELSKKVGKGQAQNQWIKDHLTEYAESFPEVSIDLEANIHRCVYGQKGFESHSFQEMWELYSQYSAQKDRPDDFGTSQREMIQKAYSSVSRWLNTPITHITSVQMKRFRKCIYDKKTQKSSSSISDPSWLDDTHLFEVIKSEPMASTVVDSQK